MMNSKSINNYHITTILEYWSGSNVIFVSDAVIEVILVVNRYNDSLFSVDSLYSTIEKRVV